jgi:hypothetical protein
MHILSPHGEERGTRVSNHEARNCGIGGLVLRDGASRLLRGCEFLNVEAELVADELIR